MNGMQNKRKKTVYIDQLVAARRVIRYHAADKAKRAILRQFPNLLEEANMPRTASEKPQPIFIVPQEAIHNGIQST